MENYSLLMGAAVDEDGGGDGSGVDGEAFPGTSRPGCRNRDSCPPHLGFAMAAALELFSYRGFLHIINKVAWNIRNYRYVETYHPSHHVCLLALVIRARGTTRRYQRIAAFLHQLGFRSTRSDASLFVYNNGNTTAYLLLYVDDIILTASSTDLLRQLTACCAEFALKDLGPLHYFLGIEVVRRTNGFFLHQRKCAFTCSGILIGLRSSGFSHSWYHGLRSLAPRSIATDIVATRTPGPTRHASLHVRYCVYFALRSSPGRLSDSPRISLRRRRSTAVANAVAEVSWLRQLLVELSCPVAKATVVYCDNIRRLPLRQPTIAAPSILSWTSTLFGNRWLLGTFEYFMCPPPNNLRIS
ncbi:hypothetical protein QYE76_030520 [Lolium multiflorum]|uniref:Reverse transcriptase Ty1/copia-type domain-containing protein n=1 Tax=Lolium multiflorum TaxID=4521 RepID=A0AAD8QQI8_LOLMU|nr:hypothetical protein QYE76_030520 [Lolium multiflorum]